MTQITVPVESESFFSKLSKWLKSINPIYFVVIVLAVGRGLPESSLFRA